MPSDFWFRLSTYLSLALASACLGYAEYDLLPEVAAFAGVVVVLLVVSFFLDRRFELSLGKANLVGLVIGILATLWMAANLANPRKDGPMSVLEWPNNLPPIVAPLLLVLIPAKLFRPKHIGDWWAMHGVAVTGVALAAAMADDIWFVLILAGYCICATWSLILFFYRRSGSLVAPIPNQPVTTPAQILSATFDERPPKYVLARSMLWLFLAACLAMPLYLVLPKGEESWSLVKRKYEIGLSKEGEVDMKSTGELKPTDEVAYHLTVTNISGQQVHELPSDLHFRGRSLSSYDRSTKYQWKTAPLQTSLPMLGVGLPTTRTLAKPDTFGPDTLKIEFHPEKKERLAVLAAPVLVSPLHTTVVSDLGAPWYKSGDFSTMTSNIAEVGNFYMQLYLPDLTDVGLPLECQNQLRLRTALLNYTQSSEPYYQQFALTVLDGLIASGRLPAGVKATNDPTEIIRPDDHEAVARAFSDYFTSSGQFEYSTTLKIKDRSADPVVDFLRNTRTGHCERFASALVLLLRAMRIPCQYVTGYRGFENDEDGNFVIRRNAAHAWVEVLVRRPPPAGYTFDTATPDDCKSHVYHWMLLDPTIGGGSSAVEKKSWWQQVGSYITALFVGYDKERREQVLADLGRLAMTVGPVALVAVIGVVVGLVMWNRKRKAAIVDVVALPWYGRYLQLFSVVALHPVESETPRETAERFTEVLRQKYHPATHLPTFVVSKLYRTRYAGQELSTDEIAQIDMALTQLEQTLTVESLADSV